VSVSQFDSYLGHVCVYTSELNKIDMYTDGNTVKSAEIKMI